MPTSPADSDPSALPPSDRLRLLTDLPTLAPEPALVFAFAADALTEVLEWANDGVGADLAAATWLAHLRLGSALGVSLSPSAPPQLGRAVDRDLASSACPVTADSLAQSLPRFAASLSLDRMGTRSHPLRGDELTSGPDDDTALLSALPIAFLEHVEPATVFAMALDTAAITLADRREQTRIAAFAAQVASAARTGSPGGIIGFEELAASMPREQKVLEGHLEGAPSLEGRPLGRDTVIEAVTERLRGRRANDSASEAVRTGVVEPTLRRLAEALEPTH